jgi:Sec-independent protein secretion pathway component TatC
MTALGLIQTSLCVSFLAAAAILLPIVHYQLYSHLRRQHRKAFDRLGINPVFCSIAPET